MRSLLAGLVAAFLVVLAAPASAQSSSDGWVAYPAYNEATAVAAASDGLWAATKGGVFFYGVPDGEFQTVTAVQGLTGGPVGALAVDADRGTVWIGYQSGVLDRLDPETGDVEPVFAIARASQYASRGIRRLRFEGDRLYAATDFGVVVLDPETGGVLEAYARFGTLAAGTPVDDVIEARLEDGRPGVWVATPGGVFTAPLDGTTLQAPGAWTADARWSGPAFSIALYRNTIYVGGGPDGARDMYRKNEDGGYGRQLFIDNEVVALAPDDDRMFAASGRATYAFYSPGAPGATYVSDGALAVRDLAIGPDGRAWAADAASGLFPLPDTEAREVIEYQVDAVVPPGPLSTSITDFDVADDGTVWLVTERLEAAGYAAVSRLDADGWTSFRTDDLSIDVARASFESASVGPGGTFYAGSAGDGVTVFADGDVTTYRPDNSSLLPAAGTTDFVVIRDVAFEDDLAWVVNFSGQPLHAFDGTSWRGFVYPAGIPSTAQAFRLAIDDFGQKWLALGGAGLGVWATGDPTTAADDQARRFSAVLGNGTGLPDGEVRDVVVDGEGRVWIGTARGIAFVFSPGSAFGGDPALATPQWPVTADGTDFLLREAEVFDLEVDPAGQIWVATSSGAFLVAASGDALVRTITSANSPLPSDAVFSVGVDPTTGRVYFVTSEGLFSGPGDAIRSGGGAETLVATPSPYRPAQTEGVVVSGLSAPVSDVRVLTVAGDVVFASEVRGGAFRWNGRNASGEPVPSGVYLVAASGSDGSTRYGKVAVLR